MTATSATIKGKVFSQNSAATAYILFGTASGVYGDSLLATPNTITADSLTTVYADFTGLNSSTTYYYCVAASNGTLYKRGGEKSFTPRNITAWRSSKGTITFKKTDYADYTQEVNQDRLTDIVWITRETSQGIFNIQSESSYNDGSPAGTEWAYGTTADIGSLTFATWGSTHNGNPPSMVNRDMVLHLIDDDIYIDIKFLSWTNNGQGGGFSYVRSAGPLEAFSKNASAITTTSATITGTVFSQDFAATAYLLYGTTSGVYNNDSVLVTPNTIPANSTVSISATLTGLSNGTVYYYRVSASNGSLYRRSAEKDFITFAPLQGNALKFDGSDDYVETPNLSALNPSTFTYEFWARVDGGYGTYRCPVSSRYWDGTCYGVNFYANDANNWDATLGTGVGGANWAGVVGSAVQNGVWTHLASTYDGTTFRFYINGELQGDTVVAFSPNTTTPLQLGRVADGDAYFNGAIDEVRIWNVARTPEQIQATMNTPFTEPQSGLVGYWQLNENTGMRAHDLISGNNGTLINFNFDATDGWKGSDTPLPVVLTSFAATAERSKAVLAWKTATEINCAGFEIERRTVGSNTWQKIGYVAGSGTSNAPKEYSYTDLKLAPGRYEYRLKQIDNNSSFKYSQSMEVEVGIMPKEFTLSQNYPNPFNPTTTIEFTLKENGFTTLKVYDIVGREVAVLVNENLEAGILHQAEFKASKLSSGVYFYRLLSGNSSIVKKLLLMK
jgi:hypothetical protein